MDHFYQNIDGWMGKQNTGMLNKVIDSLPENSIWVELGAWTGRSVAYCTVELINKNKFGKFYAVDTWDGGKDLTDNEIVKTNSVKSLFLTNISPIKDQIQIINSLSWDASINFENNSVDFCYVDAGHTYDCVMNDLTNWWPKIKTGSYFGGDDFVEEFPGVVNAVNEFFSNLKISVEKVGRCWLVRKV